MGQKLCTRSSQLHFWGVEVCVFQKFLNYEERWRSLYAIKELSIISWWIGGGLLWTFVKNC